MFRFFMSLVVAVVRSSAYSTKLPKLECVCAQKGLALPQAWNAGDVSPPGRCRRSDSRAAVPVHSAHAVVIVSKDKKWQHP